MTERTITDEAVARMPLHEGRAELLEEIMAIPTKHPRPTTSEVEDLGARRRRWLPVLGAAAAVVAVTAAVAAPAVLGEGEEGAPRPLPAAAPGSGEIAVLDDPAWTMSHASITETGGEVSYTGDASLDAEPGNDWKATVDIHWRPAEQYASYVADREHITDPPSAGEAVDVLGARGRMWAYDATDHTVVREVVGDFTLEVRGTDLAEADFRELLTKLTPVQPSELDAHLPAGFVTAGERAGAVDEMLSDVPLPAGFDSAIRSEEVDRYQLGADVTGTVVCAWLDRYTGAVRAGDQRAARAAVDALATSRDWKILKEMDASGDWPEVVWGYADTIAAGRDPRGYRSGLGCGS